MKITQEIPNSAHVKHGIFLYYFHILHYCRSAKYENNAGNYMLHTCSSEADQREITSHWCCHLTFIQHTYRACSVGRNASSLRWNWWWGELFHPCRWNTCIIFYGFVVSPSYKINYPYKFQSLYLLLYAHRAYYVMALSVCPSVCRSVDTSFPHNNSKSFTAINFKRGI